jgi:hypothetical protein
VSLPRLLLQILSGMTVSDILEARVCICLVDPSQAAST